MTDISNVADYPTRRYLTRLGEFAGHPIAFGLVLSYGALWLIFEPETFDWHGVATLATWMMTLFITRSEFRDTQAIQAKLDELLLKHAEASNEFTRLDDMEPEQIVGHRKSSRPRDRGS